MFGALTRRIQGEIGRRVDRAFVRLTFRRRGGNKGSLSPKVAERLDEAAAFYDRAARQGRLFPEPPVPVLVERPVRGLPGGRVVDVTWPSPYQALHPYHAELLAKVPENAVCHARWLRHDEGGVGAPGARPATIICLHGWYAGQFRVEERLFAAPWLHRIGFDVVLATLPFHARRAPKRGGKPQFPSANPVRSNEGLAQAVMDLRALLAALRGRGAAAVGVTGMSLGGFTAALLATVVSDLDFLVPFLPFASLPDLLWDHGQQGRDVSEAEAAGIDRSRFAAAFRATSPVHREPRIDGGRVLIIAAENDRVAPPEQAERLHRHFAGSRLITFHGSHLLQFGRGRALKALARFASRRGAEGE